jgi:predicted anti-sigma-YlaC factor YlaD
MRLIRPSLHANCEQPREAISLRLDGELPELDQARLDAHLEHCAACRALQAELDGVTTLLRAAPVDQPDFDVRLPGRRRVSVRMVQAGAAAAAVVVVAGLSTVHGLGQREAAAPNDFAASIALGHDDELTPDRHPARAPRPRFRTAV